MVLMPPGLQMVIGGPTFFDKLGPELGGPIWKYGSKNFPHAAFAKCIYTQLVCRK